MRSRISPSRKPTTAALGLILVVAVAGTLEALLPSVARNRTGTGASAGSARQSPPSGGLLTSALARSLDPGLSARCLRALGSSTVAVFCDSKDASVRRVRIRARAFAARRAKGAVVLAGHRPLYARSHVRLTGLRPTRRAQLVVLYRFPRGLVYARFSSLPTAADATVLARPRSAGALYIRLSYRARQARPKVQKTLWIKNPSVQLAPPVVPGLLATPQPYTPPETAGTCGASPVGATCDAYFDGLWHLEGPGWTGGDGALSVPLPDGRDAWLFGDTFLGTIGPDGTRPLGSPMVHNSIVLQTGQQLVTLTGAGNTAVVPDEGPDRWYWPGEGVVEGNHLRVFMQEFERTGPGLFDFAYVESDVASFSLPYFSYDGLTALPQSDGVIWGNWTLEDGTWTYIYGYPDNAGSTPFVARAPRGHVQGPWQYFDGSGWSDSPQDVAPIATGISNQCAVVKVAGGYSLISIGLSFSPEIYGRFGNSPTGPFGPPRLLYTAPTTPDTFVYSAVAHPEYTAGGELLVSYSVNAWRPEDLYTHPEYYRPQFIRVPLDALGP